MIANATGAAAMANISVAEGIAISVCDAEQHLAAALTEFATALNDTAKQQAEMAKEAQAAENRLAKWTVIQGWLAFALTLFTAAQVAIAVLQYLKGT